LRAERGIAVSYETVRRWVNHFGPTIAAHLRKHRPKPHATLHLDEVAYQAQASLDERLVERMNRTIKDATVKTLLLRNPR
jgi:putative transposase